jgi:hypothetical protein
MLLGPLARADIGEHADRADGALIVIALDHRTRQLDPAPADAVVGHAQLQMPQRAAGIRNIRERTP